MFFAPVIRRSAYVPALRSVDRGLERFFNDALFSTTGANRAKFEQDDKTFTVEIDVPGLAKEHLNLAVEDNVVRIESIPDAPRQFKAAYEFPQDIDTAASEAKLEHGVLTLKLARKVPVSNATTLAIQ
jgi:HSP20 family protein